MKVAIFNGFRFHFEMFGYILQYCKVHGHTPTVYTQEDQHGWKEFYMKLFPSLQWKSCVEFQPADHVYIFLTTDDDRLFQYSGKNVICIDHTATVRRPEIAIDSHIGTRPFASNYRKWALPCYPIVQTIQEKMKARATDLHVAVIGGCNDYTLDRLQRLSSSGPITIHVISRRIRADYFSSLSVSCKMILHENISTQAMMEILTKSKYVICDVTTYTDHTKGISMAGCIPLAFSTLNILLLADVNNALYKFTSAKVFALDSTEAIELTDDVDENELRSVYEEREKLMSMFYGHMKGLCTSDRKVALFNGLQYHHEMFGYILHYCKVNGIQPTVYTEHESYGWKKYYSDMFPNMVWKPCASFIPDPYTYVFLVTDDDHKFQYTGKNVICIDHHYTMRRPSIDPNFHIATRPFATNSRKWALPCYPIVSTVEEKMAAMKRSLHVVILGNHFYFANQINRLTSSAKITLHIICRKLPPEFVSTLDCRFQVCVHRDIPTHELMSLLKRSKYVVCDVSTHMDHTNGLSMAACIPLAFSTLNRLVLSEKNNRHYKFVTAKTFELDSTDMIELTDTIDEMEIQRIYDERASLMSSFHRQMDSLPLPTETNVQSTIKEIPCYIERKRTNTIDSRIPRNLIQTFKTNRVHDFIYQNIMTILAKNDDYNYYLITDEIGVELIRTHFDTPTLEAFQRLSVGAAKGDFLRYIAMYIYGGVYLDMDSSITIPLRTFVSPNVQHVFFLDTGMNVPQWCFMVAPKHPILLKSIHEMVRRIQANETNIFIATGPTLFSDCIYNSIQNTNIYNTNLNVSKNDRARLFMSNARCMDGIILFEENPALQFKQTFKFRMDNFREELLYTDEKRYVATFNQPTPNLYKETAPRTIVVSKTNPWTFHV